MSVITKVSGLVSFVTGGSSGLGRATATRLVQEGAKVCIFDKQDGAEVATELGNNCLYINGDVTSEENVMEAMEKTVKKFGSLNVLVNCAGIGIAEKIYGTKHGPSRMFPFEKVMKVNILGTYNTCRLAGTHFFNNEPNENGERGLIVNTSSIAAFDGQMGQVAYAASKGAIAAMTLPMARDYAGMGVRVMTIAPGVYQTPLLGQLPSKARLLLEQLILQPSEIGDPMTFAHMVQSIIENPYLNGEVIRLDGGLRMGWGSKKAKREEDQST